MVPALGKYARIEWERRFLLAQLPAAVDALDYARIDDLYIAGTHLRLRVLRRPTGEWVTTKLGQKVADPAAPEDPRRRLMTSIYLPEAEGQALDGLPGLRTSKRRYRLAEQGRVFSVDAWEAPASAVGMLVAEVEATSLEDLEAIAEPPWALREVTSDPRYSGIALARGELR
jgi:CYTH domain-containing protein